MTDKKSNDSRRKLLKSIAAGSGAIVAGQSLPESWSKPVIDSVILPAHAQTTDDSGTLPPENTTTTTTTTTLAPPVKYSLSDYSDNLVPDPAALEQQASVSGSSLSDILISPAHATPFTSVTDYYLEEVSGNSYQFTSSRSYAQTGNNYWAGGVLTLGSTASLPTKKNCGSERLYVKKVELVSVNASQAVIRVKLIFLDQTLYQYERTLTADPSAAPAVC